MAMPGDQQAQSSGVYSVTMQEMGRETITVPAGTFEAVKIQSNSTIDISTSFEGIEVPVKFNGTTISWYVPGIGFAGIIYKVRSKPVRKEQLNGSGSKRCFIFPWWKICPSCSVESTT